jgi:hypothetical protein
MEDMISVILIGFLWLVAPAMIFHSKGRRWYVWLPFCLVLPVGALVLAMFIHPVDKDGNTSIS